MAALLMETFKRGGAEIEIGGGVGGAVVLRDKMVHAAQATGWIALVEIAALLAAAVGGAVSLWSAE